MLPRSQLMLRAAAIIGDCHGDGFSRAGTAPLLRKRIAATGSTIMSLRWCRLARSSTTRLGEQSGWLPSRSPQQRFFRPHNNFLLRSVVASAGGPSNGAPTPLPEEGGGGGGGDDAEASFLRGRPNGPDSPTSSSIFAAEHFLSVPLPPWYLRSGDGREQPPPAEQEEPEAQPRLDEGTAAAAEDEGENNSSGAFSSFGMGDDEQDKKGGQQQRREQQQGKKQQDCSALDMVTRATAEMALSEEAIDLSRDALDEASAVQSSARRQVDAAGEVLKSALEKVAPPALLVFGLAIHGRGLVRQMLTRTSGAIRGSSWWARRGKKSGGEEGDHIPPAPRSLLAGGGGVPGASSAAAEGKDDGGSGDDDEGEENQKEEDDDDGLMPLWSDPDGPATFLANSRTRLRRSALRADAILQKQLPRLAARTRELRRIALDFTGDADSIRDLQGSAQIADAVGDPALRVVASALRELIDARAAAGAAAERASAAVHAAIEATAASARASREAVDAVAPYYRRLEDSERIKRALEAAATVARRELDLQKKQRRSSPRRGSIGGFLGRGASSPVFPLSRAYTDKAADRDRIYLRVLDTLPDTRHSDIRKALKSLVERSQRGFDDFARDLTAVPPPAAPVDTLESLLSTGQEAAPGREAFGCELECAVFEAVLGEAGVMVPSLHEILPRAGLWVTRSKRKEE